MAPHVALLPFPFASHPGTLFTLARALAAAAPEATFTFLSTERSLTPLAAAAATLNNVRLLAIADGCPSPVPTDVEVQIGLFLRAAPGNIRAGVEAAGMAIGVRVSCIVSDAFIWTAREVADGMGVPWVALWTGHSGSLSAHIHTDLIRKTIGLGGEVDNRGQETLSFIPGLTSMQLQDLPKGILTGDVNSGFARLLHRMGKELPNAAAVVLNTIEGLDPEVDTNFKAIFQEYLPMGPISLLTAPATVAEDPEVCLPWLDQRSPATVAYISFGTAISLPPEELAALAEGLEVSGTPFIWSLKVHFRKHLPIGFIERTAERQGLVVSWAPQVRVLAHKAVGVVLHNCGWNSVMESISSGVPMVCRPLIGDNFMAERMATEVLGIAVGFKGRVVTKKIVVSSLKMVLKEEEGKKMRERICKLKAMANKAVGPEGSSTKSFFKLLEIVHKG